MVLKIHEILYVLAELKLKPLNTSSFLLHCQLYSTHRSELFDKIVKIDQQFFNLTAKDLLYGYYTVVRDKEIILKIRIKISSILFLNILNQLLVSNFEGWRGGTLVTRYSGTKITFSEKNIGRPLIGWGRGFKR